MSSGSFLKFTSFFQAFSGHSGLFKLFNCRVTESPQATTDWSEVIKPKAVRVEVTRCTGWATTSVLKQLARRKIHLKDLAPSQRLFTLKNLKVLLSAFPVKKFIVWYFLLWSANLFRLTKSASCLVSSCIILYLYIILYHPLFVSHGLSEKIWAAVSVTSAAAASSSSRVDGLTTWPSAEISMKGPAIFVALELGHFANTQKSVGASFFWDLLENLFLGQAATWELEVTTIDALIRFCRTESKQKPPVSDQWSVVCLSFHQQSNQNKSNQQSNQSVLFYVVLRCQLQGSKVSPTSGHLSSSSSPLRRTMDTTGSMTLKGFAQTMIPWFHVFFPTRSIM